MPAKEQESYLWDFAPLSQIHPPIAPTADTIQQKWISTKQLIAEYQYKKNKSPIDIQDLRSLPISLLNQIAPPINWKETAKQLNALLQPWLDEKQDQQRIQIIVAPPGFGMQQILTHLAKIIDWPIYDSPTNGQILADTNNLSNSFDEINTPLIIPNLEQFYLRHHDGLNYLRKQMSHMIEHNEKIIIGCDSWAWSYLIHAIKIDSLLPEPLAPIPFSPIKMEYWLRNQLSFNGRFLKISDGSLLLPEQRFPVNHDDLNRLIITEKPINDVAKFIRQICYFSRGIPEVAWHLWRLAFQLTQEALEEANQIEPTEEAQNKKEAAIWVNHWEKMQLPSVPSHTTHTDLVIAHTLLLHKQLSINTLDQILPITRSAVIQSLDRLSKSSLINEKNSLYSVAPIAYPVVRQKLYDSGYLIDSF